GGVCFKFSIVVYIKRWPGMGKYSQVGKAIVIEVSRCDRDDAFQPTQACIRYGNTSVLQQLHAAFGPHNKVRITVTVEIQNRQAAGCAVNPGCDLLELELERRRGFAIEMLVQLHDIVNLRIEAPFRIFGDRSAGLALLDLVERVQLAGCLLLAAKFPISVVEL